MALKTTYSTLSEAFLRSDNAGCYHNAFHWTKKWIYIKFAQHKDVANICLLLSKSVADMVNATFAAIFTLVRKYGSKCGIYHVCLRFSLELIYVCNIFALCKFNVNPFFRPVFLILSLPSIGERAGIRVLRYDFSDPQAGKDVCDRRIATLKSHMRRFINEGNDINTAQQMKVAIESYGGIKGCYATVAEIQDSFQNMTKQSMTGIQALNNFLLEPAGLRAWKAYTVGRDMSRNARNNKNGKKENIMANLANMAKMTILPESPTWQSTKQ